jgi:hypothetical protein
MTALQRALAEQVTVNEGGKTKRMRKLDCAMRQQVNKAAAGDSQAVKLIAQLLRAAGDGTDSKQPITIVLDEIDQKL